MYMKKNFKEMSPNNTTVGMLVSVVLFSLFPKWEYIASR